MLLFRASRVARGISQAVREALAQHEKEEVSRARGLRRRALAGDAEAVAYRRAQVEAWHETGRSLGEIERLAAQKGVRRADVRTAALILERRGVLRRPSNWTLVLSALARVGDAAGATAMVERMEAPTTVAYNAALRACAKGRAAREAEIVLLERMPARGVEPDAVSYATAVAAQDAWTSRAREWTRRACDIGDARAKMLACREAMRLSGRAGDWREAVRVLIEEMPRVGLRPDSRDFREATHACAAAGRVDAARRVLDLAVSRNLDDDATWARYVFACGRAGRANEAVEAYGRLAARRAPDETAVVATTVLKAALQHDGPRAEAFLTDEVLANDHPTTVETYAWAMRALAKTDWERCVGLLAAARDDGHEITGDVIAVALEALGAAGQTAVLADLVDEMGRHGIALADAGLAAVVRCKTNAGAPNDALFAFREDPRWHHAGSVVAALEACKAIPDADSALAILEEHESVAKPTRAIAACASALAASGDHNWARVVDLVTTRAASPRAAYNVALDLCLDDGLLGAVGLSEEQLLPRLKAAADCWDAGQRRNLFPELHFGKRDKVLNLDVHGSSVPVASAAVLAALRRAYATNPAMPPTLCVVTGSAAKRPGGSPPRLQPSLVHFLKATFNVASRVSETNSGMLIIASASIKAWGDRHRGFFSDDGTTTTTTLDAGLQQQQQQQQRGS